MDQNVYKFLRIEPQSSAMFKEPLFYRLSVFKVASGSVSNIPASMDDEPQTPTEVLPSGSSVSSVSVCWFCIKSKQNPR